MEFVAFKEKLERSHQLIVARVELVILTLKRKANNVDELEVNISLQYGALQNTPYWFYRFYPCLRMQECNHIYLLQ